MKQDADLAGIRDNQELAKLPDQERAELEQLWDDVDGLRKTQLPVSSLRGHGQNRPPPECRRGAFENPQFKWGAKAHEGQSS